MANEIRLRSNNIAGSITDNPLTSGATTINSPGFVDLPTVDTTNHLLLILDPLEANGAAEIVRVTTHTAAASVVTVVRGAENTTPRQHPLGTTWFHGPVVSDFEPFLATSGARPAIPFTGESIYETDTVRNMQYTGTAWTQQGLQFDPPACRVYHDTTQSIAHGTFQALVFNTERYDTNAMHSTSSNTSRVTINTAGLYVLNMHAEFTAAADYTDIIVGFRLNGDNAKFLGLHRDKDPGGVSDTRIMSISTVWKFNAADFAEAFVFQTNGAVAARNVAASTADGAYRAEFAATWVGRGN